MECCLQLCSVQHKKDRDLTDPEEARKMIRGLEHLSYEGRLRELRVFSLEKRMFWGEFTAASQYIKGA